MLFFSIARYFSQNLILNPSFEDSVNNCTSHIQQNSFYSSLFYAQNWFVPSYSNPDLRNENSPFYYQFGYILEGFNSYSP